MTEKVNTFFRGHMRMWALPLLVNVAGAIAPRENAIGCREQC